MMERSTIVVPIVAILSILPALFFARWVLRPLERASERTKARLQITIADILCLFLQIQLLLAIFKWAWNVIPHDSEAIATLVLIFVVTFAVWLGSAAVLARAGVRNVWHRVFVLIIGIPVGVVGSVVVSGTPVAFVLVAMTAKWDWGLLWLAPVALVTLGLLVGIRLAIGRIVAAAQRRNGE